jgi:glycogen debranching enzyme
MKIGLILFLGLAVLTGCKSVSQEDLKLAGDIKTNESFKIVKEKAQSIIKVGFSAGDGYGEIWIRDFNTFMNLSLDVNSKELNREKLLVFFNFQGDDGNIPDGYIPRERMAIGAYDYTFSESEPRFAAHKNTVETDQESSLIQGVYKYVTKSGDKDILNVEIDGKTVTERLEFALDYLFTHRFNEKYGLIYGGTTADWGDVQPETVKGVVITDSTHFAIDIYDNAMLVIALKNFIEIVPGAAKKWSPVLKDVEKNIRKYLWDSENMKFRPHVYIDGSPFPEDFNEDEIFYMGGTAVAIEAGLLSREEIKVSLEKMIKNANAVGAATIGLTMYPAYPLGFFKHKILTVPYTYQNGGDWTWFGGRMLQQLVKYGFVTEAYQQTLPFAERVIKNDGFYEWYSIKNEPRGSSSYRGSAGVLYDAIVLLDKWADEIDAKK